MSIRKKVANLWAPLLQSKGNSTTQPMSQKAVSDELNQLKSDLVNKNDVLSLEEIQASTDLTNKVASASALKSVNSKLEKKLHDSVYSESFNVLYNEVKTGIFPVYYHNEGDYYVIQIYRDTNYGCQVRIRLSDGKLERRLLKEGTWDSWYSFN